MASLSTRRKAAFAAAIYYQHGHIRLPVAGIIAAGFMIGAVGGASLLPHVPLAALRIAFGGVLLCVGILFLFETRSAQLKAILPVVLTLIVACLFHGKRRQRLMPESLDSHTEYHI